MKIQIVIVFTNISYLFLKMALANYCNAASIQHKHFTFTVEFFINSLTNFISTKPIFVKSFLITGLLSLRMHIRLSPPYSIYSKKAAN